jgi:predicted nucleic acid-binding protein
LSLYLDASVLVRLLESDPSVLDLIGGESTPLLVSSFAAGEVSAAISRLVRTGDLPSADAAKLLRAFDSWRDAAAEPIATDARDITEGDRIVRDFALKLKLPDAIHLASAHRHGATLVTSDRRLAAAAQDRGMPVLAL